MTLVNIGNGDLLGAQAAAAYLQARAAGMPAGGINSAYRSHAEQAHQFNDNYTRDKALSTGKDKRTWNGVAYWRRARKVSNGAPTVSVAVPGTSNHERGTALDIDTSSAAYAWLRKHGAAFGWIADRVPNELWHFEFDASHVQAPTTQPPMESEITMIYLMLKDNNGRYGAKNIVHFATYDGRAFVEIGAEDANAIAVSNLAGRSFSNVSYGTWEGYHSAASIIVDARRKG